MLTSATLRDHIGKRKLWKSSFSAGWFSMQPSWQSRILWLAHPGAASGSTDLLPAPSPSTNWTASLLTDSGRDSDLIYRFDGHQAANVPDHVVPQNLTDQFTIATWMKHGPSPGLRAEKETLLCNSDKTGEETTSHVLTVKMYREVKFDQLEQKVLLLYFRNIYATLGVLETTFFFFFLHTILHFDFLVSSAFETYYEHNVIQSILPKNNNTIKPGLKPAMANVLWNFKLFPPLHIWTELCELCNWASHLHIARSHNGLTDGLLVYEMCSLIL